MMEDKFDDQSHGYEAVDDYEALPLAGAGRWAEIPGGTLYTNDANVLFLKTDGSAGAGHVFLKLDKAYKQGKSATDAFNTLSAGADITSGDLSQLA